MSKQGPSGFVPGGFLIVIVWERVQGLPLGVLTGNATGYWALPRHERAKIRKHFEGPSSKLANLSGSWVFINLSMNIGKSPLQSVSGPCLLLLTG